MNSSVNMNPKMTPKRQLPANRGTRLRSRRWWLLALLAGQGPRRVPYRKFLERAAVVFTGSPECEGLSWEQVRDALRHDLGVLAALRPAGAVRLETRGNGKQIGYVVLSKSGARRWLWAEPVKELIKVTTMGMVGVARAASIAFLAKFTGKSTSTVYRWLAGDTVPSPVDIKRLMGAREDLPLFAVTARTGIGALSDFMMEATRVHREMLRRGFSEREHDRAMAYLEENLWEPFYNAGWDEAQGIDPNAPWLRKLRARTVASTEKVKDQLRKLKEETSE